MSLQTGRVHNDIGPARPPCKHERGKGIRGVGRVGHQFVERGGHAAIPIEAAGQRFGVFRRPMPRDETA